LGHTLNYFANFGLHGAVLNLDEHTRVYPASRDVGGNDMVKPHARHVKADIVITLFDAWVFRKDVFSSFRWVPWCPVDHEPIPPAVADKLQVAYKPIAYSKFGYEQMKAVGLDPAYVPHGIDMNLYKPGDKAEARDIIKWPQDTFIALMVAANKDGPPSRKAFEPTLLAWSEFVKRYPKSRLHIHARPTPDRAGVDLFEICRALEIPRETISFCDPYWQAIGFPAAHMVRQYQAADVLLNPAMGEGFGLPILEAQACGCPVIVGNWTSMPELCFAGWKVRGQPMWSHYSSWQFMPFTNDIYNALVKAYKTRHDQVLREHAREGALPYDADRVTEEYWKPVLEEIQHMIEKGGGLEMVDLSDAFEEGSTSRVELEDVNA